MKKIICLLSIASLISFTFLNPKGKVLYRSPDLDKTMVYIPTHSFNYREADTLIIDDAFVLTTIVTVKSFYMFPHEVSNGQYLEYVNALRSSGDTTWRKALPDTLVWRPNLSYNEPYVEFYFRHPAYWNHPVVGVSHAQCEEFCRWLTEKYNETEKRKFKRVKFRLPSKQEWYASAAYAKTEKEKTNRVVEFNDRKLFPWKGESMRNSDGKYQANFVIMDESSMHREYDTVPNVYGAKSVRRRYVGESGYFPDIAGNWNDMFDLTAPVKSYWPNEMGIYNMGGNVEEFVAEYGITKGGSWRDPGYYLRNEVVETYDSTNEATSSRGFRFVMEVIEE